MAELRTGKNEKRRQSNIRASRCPRRNKIYRNASRRDPRSSPGDNVGFKRPRVAKKDIKRGDVQDIKIPTKRPKGVLQHKSFSYSIKCDNCRGGIQPPVFHAHTAQVACTFTGDKGKSSILARDK